jgi:hypothetical protein
MKMVMIPLDWIERSEGTFSVKVPKQPAPKPSRNQTQDKNAPASKA